MFERAQDYITALDVARRHELAEFIGVKPQTLRSYLRGKSVPTGRRVLQLHCILVWAGYGDHRWKMSDPNVEMVANAYTFKLITDDELVAAFEGECDEVSRIVQMMIGNKHIAPAAQEVFNHLAGTYSWEIKAAQEKRNNLKIIDQKDKLIAELANKFQQLLPLVADVSGDGWTADDRHELRTRAGKGVVLELYNHLGYLCGERHRKVTKAERARQAAISMMCRQA
jgi:hypothetical protein